MTAGVCLVTGASGALGPRVVQALYDVGFSMCTLSRNPPPADLLYHDTEVHVGDITDQSIVQAAMQGVDVVIHLAALLHIVNPPLALQERYEQINAGGTANVVQAAIASGVWSYSAPLPFMAMLRAKSSLKIPLRNPTRSTQPPNSPRSALC